MRQIVRGILVQLCFIAAFTASGQAPLKSRDSTITGPQSFAMILGISDYKFVRPLTYADKDAELFRDFLKSPAGGRVKEENIYSLLNEKATNSNFWVKGFQWLKAKNLRRGDKLFIYLSGHGDAIDENQFFFLGYDCNPGGDKNNYLVGGAIQLFNLKLKIASETAKGVDVFFIMDACRSNELPGGIQGRESLSNAITEKRAGEIIMLASSAGQESLEDASIGTGNGLFTYYLVNGLSGMADSAVMADYKVSFRELQQYVNKNVPTVAQERFKRVQEPFFCCNEKSDNIISRVDTVYLRNWLKTRKGPGNSFTGIQKTNSGYSAADTTLIETYNRFNNAVSNNNITGRSSAEDYYRQLETKFPGNPYTLDAKTTLAVEYINFAQNKMNQYLGCGDPKSKAQKKEFYEAGNRLEKAIAIIREEEPEFSRSYISRMYFLKASGDESDLNPASAFQLAFASYALDPGAAFINNRLATLHLDNNRLDSAEFYARKAIFAAPKWSCTYATLGKVYRSLNIPDSASKYEQRAAQPDPSIPGTFLLSNNRPGRKFQFGVVVGVGSNKPQLSFTNWERGQINYHDSLNAITSDSRIRSELGWTSQVNFSNRFAMRPSVLLSLEGGNIVYDRKTPIGTRILDTVKLSSTTVNMFVPGIFKFSDKETGPYLSLGPAFSYLLQQDADYSSKIPLKSFGMLAEIGIGVDISFLKGFFFLSPEIKFTRGFTDMKSEANNIYTNTLADLKKQAFTFSLYLRRR